MRPRDDRPAACRCGAGGTNTAAVLTAFLPCTSGVEYRKRCARAVLGTHSFLSRATSRMSVPDLAGIGPA